MRSFPIGNDNECVCVCIDFRDLIFTPSRPLFLFFFFLFFSFFFFSLCCSVQIERIVYERSFIVVVICQCVLPMCVCVCCCFFFVITVMNLARCCWCGGESCSVCVLVVLFRQFLSLSLALSLHSLCSFVSFRFFFVFLGGFHPHRKRATQQKNAVPSLLNMQSIPHRSICGGSSDGGGGGGILLCFQAHALVWSHAVVAVG